MATISQITSSKGILHPKMVYRFKARFYDDQNTDLSVISDQIVSISPINQSKKSSFNTLTISLQDDASGELLKAIQRLWNITEFKMIIDHLDGNEHVISSFVLTKCWVDQVTYGALDYRGRGSKLPKLTLKTPFKGGDLIESMKDDPITETISELLNGMELTFDNSNEPILKPWIEHLLHISFSGLEIVS